MPKNIEGTLNAWAAAPAEINGRSAINQYLS